MKRLALAVAALALAGTAFAVPGFVYYGAPTAGAQHSAVAAAPGTWYHGSQPGFVYHGAQPGYVYHG